MMKNKLEGKTFNLFDARSISYAVLTQSEFIEIFNLDSKCRVQDITLEQMSKFIVGSHLLSIELFKSLTFKSEMLYNGRNIEFSTYTHRHEDFRRMSHGFFDVVETKVLFKFIDDNKLICFSKLKISDDDELQALIAHGYSLAEQKLKQLWAESNIYWGVEMLVDFHREYDSKMFWRTTGFDLPSNVFYINEYGVYQELKKLDMRKKLSNNLIGFVERIHPHIKRILESIVIE